MHTGAKKASRYLPDNGDMAGRVNKFQLRPVACAVRDAESRSLLHGKTGLSAVTTRDSSYVIANHHAKLSDWALFYLTLSAGLSLFFFLCDRPKGPLAKRNVLILYSVVLLGGGN